MDNNKTYKEWLDSFTTNFTYYNPAIEDENGNKYFPIIGGGKYLRPISDGLNLEILDTIRDCGFTVCNLGSTGVEGIVSTMNIAQDVPIRLMFNNNTFYMTHQNNDGGFEGGIMKFLTDRLNPHFDIRIPYFKGIYMYDEPTYYQIIGKEAPDVDHPINDGGFKDNPTKLQDDYRDLMEQVLANPSLQLDVFINLIGDYTPAMPTDADMVGFNGTKYQKYLQAYQDNFKPSVFCYDLYPIEEHSNLLYAGTGITQNGAEGSITLHSLFYTHFVDFKNISEANDRPFWAYCESKSYIRLNPKSPRYLPLALEQYLRYEAFSAIAYGAKGLLYWSYAVTENRGEESYITALTNRRHEKTASWYYAQKVNNEIQKYRDIFLKGALWGTEKTNYFVNSYLRPTNAGEIEIACEGRNDIVVAAIAFDMNLHFLVVNTDPLNYNTINIILRNTNNFIEVTPVKSGGAENTLLNNGITSRVLIPGGYRIFKVGYRIEIPPLGR